MKNFFTKAFVFCQVLVFVHQGWSQTWEGTETKVEKKPSNKVQKFDVFFTVKLPSQALTGAPVRLIGVLHNQGKAEIRVFMMWGNNLRVKMVDSQGKETPLTRYGQIFYPKGPITGSAGIKVLSPGQSMQEELELHRVFDLTIPDTYTLSVSREVILPSGKPLELKVESLSLRVLDPPP